MSKYGSSALKTNASIKAIASVIITLIVVVLIEYAFLAGKMDSFLNGKRAAMTTPVIIIGAIVVLMSILLNVSTLISASKYNKLLAKYSEASLLEELNNHMIQAHKNANGKKVYITEKYLISPDNCILETSQIAWQYTHVQNNVPHFTLKTLDGKEYRPGISTMGGTTDKSCVEALKKVNPSILIGFSDENKKLYKKMVKEHKGD